MKLLLDMGNSRLKSAVLTETGELSDSDIIAYGQRKPVEVLTNHLDNKSIELAVIVSVLGDEFREQAEELLKHRNIPFRWVVSQLDAKGVVNHYHQPKQLGSDRFVALVAARKAFPEQTCVVIDCGTAVTIDSLSEKGEFFGGVIIPGLRLWSDSLIGRADQLHEHQIQETELLAKDTAQAIGSGSVFGLTSAIEGICLRMSQELQKRGGGADSKFVICGGDAELITQYSQLTFELMPNLVLMGLAEYT